MIINVGEGGGAGKAQSVKYDNSTSKLSADNVQGAIDELDVELKEVKTSFQDGCNTIVSGITAQGVTPKSNSPADIVTAVNTVATNKYNAGVTATKVGNAGVAHVLTGKTFTNSSGVGLTGTMPNKGAVTGSITTSGGTYTIPAGYHSGSGKVTGPTLAGLVGTNVTLASAGNLLTGNTAYGKNGTKYTGSMANKGAWTSSPKTSGKVTIPAGYHNGSGYVDTSNVYKKLWTNSNPNTAFNAQTVSLSLSGYGAVLIKCKWRDTELGSPAQNTFFPYTKISVGSTDRVIGPPENGEYISYRNVTVSTTGVNFSTGYYKGKDQYGQTNNGSGTNYCIPLEIWGVPS